MIYKNKASHQYLKILFCLPFNNEYLVCVYWMRIFNDYLYNQITYKKSYTIDTFAVAS